jgi:hypothetical protein
MKLGERQFQLRIPLSPPEVKTFGIEKLPWVIVLDKNEEEVGKIIENPVQLVPLKKNYYTFCSKRNKFRLK